MQGIGVWMNAEIPFAETATSPILSEAQRAKSRNKEMTYPEHQNRPKAYKMGSLGRTTTAIGLLWRTRKGKCTDTDYKLPGRAHVDPKRARSYTFLYQKLAILEARVGQH